MGNEGDFQEHVFRQGLAILVEEEGFLVEAGESAPNADWEEGLCKDIKSQRVLSGCSGNLLIQKGDLRSVVAEAVEGLVCFL